MYSYPTFEVSPVKKINRSFQQAVFRQPTAKGKQKTGSSKASQGQQPPAMTGELPQNPELSGGEAVLSNPQIAELAQAEVQQPEKPEKLSDKEEFESYESSEESGSFLAAGGLGFRRKGRLSRNLGGSSGNSGSALGGGPDAVGGVRGTHAVSGARGVRARGRMTLGGGSQQEKATGASSVHQKDSFEGDPFGDLPRVGLLSSSKKGLK